MLVSVPRAIRLNFLAPLFLAIASAIPTQSLLAQSGIITGKIEVATSQEPVAGAVVRLVGTRLGAVTDSSGQYRIASVPAGRYELETRRPGMTGSRQTVSVGAGETVVQTLHMAAAPQDIGGIEVIGSRADALARFAGSASMVSEKQLRSQQPFSANEALRTLPGVSVQEEEGAGLRANIGIRGMDPDRSRTLLVLEDGLPVTLAPYGEPEAYYSPPIERMSRLEVIKGSGSILFGPQTVGGVVNYVTADAPIVPAGHVMLQRGGGETSLIRAGYGGTWQNTRAMFSGFRKTAGDLAGLEMDVFDLTGKFGVRAGRNDFGFKVGVYSEESNSTYVGLTDSIFRAAPHTHPAPDDRLRLRRYSISATHERALGTASGIRTSAYAYTTERDWQRQDFTYSPSGNAIVFQNSTGNRDRSFEVAGIEPRVNAIWSLGGFSNAFEGGVRAHVERARDQMILGSTGTSRTGAIRDDEERTGIAFAGFVQNRIFLGNSLQVTPGLRWESLDYERNILRTRVRRTQPDGSTTRLPEDVDIRTSDSVSELIPGIAAAWNPSELFTVFAGAHRGFAPPRTKDALVYEDATIPVDAQVPSPVSLQLDAERSTNVEFGARVTPFGWLTLETTVFRLDFSNQIIEPSLSAGSAAQAELANQGRTMHQGIEAAIAVDVGRLAGASYSLVLSANHTAVDAVFAGERLVENTAGDIVNIEGNRLPYSANHRSHAAVEFDHPIGLGLRVDGLFVGEQFSDLFETREGSLNGRVGAIPAHRVFDVAAQYRLPLGATLMASVKNVTGETYIASRRPQGIKPGLPRLAQVGLRLDF
jgi:Fe(3+) dicitrate transport protein